jgi:hypothetical protein
VEEIVPVLVMPAAQRVLQLGEEEVIVPPPLFVMVPVTDSEPLKFMVASLLTFPVMVAPLEKVELPPVLTVSPLPRLARPPKIVVPSI